MARERSNPLRVLHVDDDEVNCMVMDAMLKHLGHDTTGVRSAAEVIALLSSEAFDLIITDIHMPGMTGMEMFDFLMAQPSAVLPPVIAATADLMTRKPDEYRKQGFAAVIAKPYMVEDIEQAISAARERVFFQSGFPRAVA